MMNLTAIILVGPGDDERSVVRAQQSVQFADEIVVWEEDRPVTDFSQVRNKALKKAKGEWVLFLDSDEEVSALLAGEVQQAVRQPTINNQQSTVGFLIRRQDFFLGRWLRHGETANIRLLRLARKDAGEWERPVHEVWKIDGGVGQLTNPLLHYSHPSIREMFVKIDQYATIEAQFRKMHPAFSSFLGGPDARQPHRHPQGVPGDGAPRARVTQFQVRNITELILFPTLKFFQNYVIRLGFLDGMPGFLMAAMMSFHSFLVRAKLIELLGKRHG